MQILILAYICMWKHVNSSITWYFEYIYKKKKTQYPKIIDFFIIK